jgi:hypothetical protein
MPYITQERRVILDNRAGFANTPGDLNYLISKEIDTYLLQHGISYQKINDVIGVLECAKLEAYARIARPYEANKAYENGDVYACININTAALRNDRS